jgi:hypothetical protein
MEYAEIINFLLGFIVMLLSAGVSVLWGRIKACEVLVSAVQSDLSGYKVFVATNHPTHDGIDKRFDQVDRQLMRVFETMEKINDKLSNAIENGDFRK